MKSNKRKRVNPKYKDRVFKFIFGNPANKEWTLALYNSVNGSNHSNPDDIRFNTIDEMPDDFVIREFLFANRAGVKAMFLTEYDEEREKELLRREERRETEKEIRESVATDMLKKHYPLDAIKDISKLPEAAIRQLAKSIGVAVL